jgi:hypothetical protein
MRTVTTRRANGSAIEEEDGETATAGGPSNARSLFTITSSTSRTRRIQKYIDKLLAMTVMTAVGNPLRHVQLALAAAELQTTHQTEARACRTGEVPAGDARCYYAMSRFAKDAGPHLLSMGFDEIETNWELHGAVKGDIAVFPAVRVGGVSYPNGYICVKHTDNVTVSDQWVGEIRAHK